MTRDGVLLVVAHKSGLIKDSAITTDERPLGSLNHRAGIILNREADVEDLAAVGHISIVAILLSGARKAEVKRLVEEGLGLVGKLVAQVSRAVLGKLERLRLWVLERLRLILLERLRPSKKLSTGKTSTSFSI